MGLSGPKIPTLSDVSPSRKHLNFSDASGYQNDNKINIYIEHLLPSSHSCHHHSQSSPCHHRKGTYESPEVPEHPLHHLLEGINHAIPCSTSQRVCDHYKVVALSRKACMMARRVKEVELPPLSLDFLNIIHMHNIARTFTCYTIALSIHDISPSSQIYIALDGSGGSQRKDSEDSPATWAFVVFSYDSDEQIHFHGFYGNTLDQSSEALPIKSQDSFEAETTAFSWALVWILSNCEFLQSSSSITLLFDSMSAIYTSTGIWQAKEPRPITLLAQSFWEAVVCAFPQTVVHHVKSHDDHPMNEFADSVCTAISEGNLNLTNFSRNLDFRPHTEAMKWFFLPFLSPEAQLAYPKDLFYDPLSRRLGCSDL